MLGEREPQWMPVTRSQRLTLATVGPVSRQRRLQIRWKAEGKCVTCGRPRNLYADMCDWHHLAVAEWQRRRAGSKPWQPGTRGRIPLWWSATR
jgi:hypothetical protein